MPFPRSTVIAFVLVAVATAGCSLTAERGPRSWGVAAQSTDGKESTVNINDRTGHVLDIEVDPPAAHHPGGNVGAVDGDPKALDVPWVAGSCDRMTTLDIGPAGAGLVVTVQIQQDAGVCDDMGIVRTLRLHLDAPLPPGAVTVRE